MGGIKEKKRKGRSIGSDRREEEDNSVISILLFIVSHLLFIFY